MYHAHTQRKDDESVLGIISGLEGVIPVVEHLDEWAHKTDRQNKRYNYWCRPRSHLLKIP
jgi:hypothetical protein